MYNLAVFRMLLDYGKTEHWSIQKLEKKDDIDIEIANVGAGTIIVRNSSGCMRNIAVLFGQKADEKAS